MARRIDWLQCQCAQLVAGRSRRQHAIPSQAAESGSAISSSEGHGIEAEKSLHDGSTNHQCGSDEVPTDQRPWRMGREENAKEKWSNHATDRCTNGVKSRDSQRPGFKRKDFARGKIS